MAKKRERKELGKGLRALLSTIDEQTEFNDQEEVVRSLASNFIDIPVDQIEENPFQPRIEFEKEALEELSQSIKTHGLIQPITVRRLSDSKFQIISGERRWRATKKAGIAQIPAYIRLADDQEMLEMALVENIQREELNPIEIAISYQRLLDECNLSHDQLSDRVGKKRSTITNYVRLLKLPPQVQTQLGQGSLSMGHARALAGLSDIDMQLDILHEIMGRQLSVRQTEQLVKRYQTPPSKEKKESNALKPEYQSIEDSFCELLGTKVALSVGKNGKGSIKIPFSSTGELNRIIEIIER